ncbi:MAG: hypothetical protein Ct9H300mP28_02410 [Pseudomonadota bacterium]|nr:MAG: hypothetical protein Ct9H300mP28_02410 [Pseudomonadota bacterium]
MKWACLLFSCRVGNSAGDEEGPFIDAAEFNNPTSDSDFGMQDVSKHYHLASFHPSQECFEVTFNARKFNSLSKEQQAILEYASEAENSNFYWHNTLRYADDLIKLKKKHGVNVFRTPEIWS